MIHISNHLDYFALQVVVAACFFAAASGSLLREKVSASLLKDNVISATYLMYILAAFALFSTATLTKIWTTNQGDSLLLYYYYAISLFLMLLWLLFAEGWSMTFDPDNLSRSSAMWLTRIHRRRDLYHRSMCVVSVLLRTAFIVPLAYNMQVFVTAIIVVSLLHNGIISILFT